MREQIVHGPRVTGMTKARAFERVRCETKERFERVVPGNTKRRFFVAGRGRREVKRDLAALFECVQVDGNDAIGAHQSRAHAHEAFHARLASTPSVRPRKSKLRSMNAMTFDGSA